MKRFPFFHQTNLFDCGPACLRMIAQYYGISCSSESIISMSGMEERGVSLLGLGQAAEALGFRVLALEISFTDILSNDLFPFIAYWCGVHFIVVYDVAEDGVWIADPARELLKLSTTEFLEHWTVSGKDMGIALLIEPFE